MSNPNSLAQRVADAFNHHGKFTAGTSEHDLAINVRHVDTGYLATTVWIPNNVSGWLWFPIHDHRVADEPRELDRRTAIEEIVRAVATSVLDEGPAR